MNNLEAYLLELARYGKVRISQQSKGWYCCVEMHVEAKGCSFEVKSEFNHTSPTEAATVCLERVREALAGFGEADNFKRVGVKQ